MKAGVGAGQSFDQGRPSFAFEDIRFCKKRFTLEGQNQKGVCRNVVSAWRSCIQGPIA